MAELVLTDATLWLAELALHGRLNSIGLSLGVDVKEVTAFGDLYREKLGGLKAWGLQMDGHYDAPYDAVLLSSLGFNSVPVTVAPLSTVGAVAYVGQAIEADYSIGAAVGEVLPFSAGAQSTGVMARGLLMENSTRIVTANGTGQQLGALSATQFMAVALHVPVVSGTTPNLTVLVESDDNSGFTTPTTRNTFTAFTAAGSAFVRIAGPVTDDWWRFKFTITGTTPSFAIAGAMGRY